jgi:hypothetical protein
LRRILLEFESFRDFIQAFSPVVCEEGMFVEAEHLRDNFPQLGEKIDFEVALTDDFRLVHGRGEVVGVREVEDSEGGAGAAVRFVNLDEPSRRLVSRLLANYAKDGGRLFELPVESAAVEAAVEPEPLARSEADELFTPDPGMQTGGPEILDAMPLDSEQADPSVTPSEPIDQDAVPTLELDVDELMMSEDDIFDLPSPHLDEIPELEGAVVPEPKATEPKAPEIVMPETEVREPLGPPAATEERDLTEVELPAEPPSLDVDLSVSAASESGAAIPVISEDVAQIAEELSGVHKAQSVEMPSEDDQISLAGAGRASEDRQAWRVPLFASLAGIALALAAWYFAGDQIKSLLGLSDAAGEVTPVVAEVQEKARAAAEDEVRADGREDESTSSDAEPAPVPEADDAVEATAQSESVAAEPISEEPAAPVSQVERITWQVGEAETVVSIVLDGAVTETSYEVLRIRQGAPREVIKISGVSRPFNPRQLEVGSSQVQRLRMAVHATPGGSEIHVVADLTGPAVATTLVRAEGKTILVTFS